MKDRIPLYVLVGTVAVTPTWPHRHDVLAAPPYVNHEPHPEPLPVPGVPERLTQMTVTGTSTAGPASAAAR